MRHKLFTSLFVCTAFSLGLSANTHAAPSVAVDIAPLHSLVSQVMGNVSQPSLIIPAEASPHHYTMRPSEAKALADADIVFWMGESFTPWLEKAINNVARSAQKIAVLDIDGTITHSYREGATFESHEHHEEHGDDRHEGEKHGKDEHHEEKEHHAKDKHHDTEEHHEKEEHHDQHHEEGNDPHAWLDPENAKFWVNHIKDTLSKQDPENATTYANNATKTIASLDALIESTRTKINALGNPQFIVFHDAYQYFETRFGIAAAGAISFGDAQAPSPARLKEVRDTVKKLGVTCVFTEPQYNPGLVKNVFENTSVSTIGVMDPLGVGLKTGSGHYQQLIQNMANSISQCQ
jgi:zinc transport system substrate-binding protein